MIEYIKNYIEYIKRKPLKYKSVFFETKYFSFRNYLSFLSLYKKSSDIFDLYDNLISTVDMINCDYEDNRFLYIDIRYDVLLNYFTLKFTERKFYDSPYSSFDVDLTHPIKYSFKDSKDSVYHILSRYDIEYKSREEKDSIVNEFLPRIKREYILKKIGYEC